jgi:hypothetical protein
MNDKAAAPIKQGAQVVKSTANIKIRNHQWPVKVKSKVACSTGLLDNSGDETLYQQGGTDHEQSIHDILRVIEAVSEIPF